MELEVEAPIEADWDKELDWSDCVELDCLDELALAELSEELVC